MSEYNKIINNKIQYLYSAIITRCYGALQYNNNNNSTQKFKTLQYLVKSFKS